MQKRKDNTVFVSPIRLYPPRGSMGKGELERERLLEREREQRFRTAETEYKQKPSMQAWNAMIEHASKPEYNAYAAERLLVIRFLKQQGYHVVVPLPSVQETGFAYFAHLAKKLGAETHSYAFRKREMGKRYSEWIRDQAQVVGNTLFVNPKAKNTYLKDFAQDARIVKSRNGEGGRVVYGEGFAFVAKSHSKSDARMLHAKGFETIKLKSGIVFKPLRAHKDAKAETYLQGHALHPDLGVHVFPKSRIILADPFWFKKNKKTLLKTAEKFHYAIVRVHRDEYSLFPANALELPDGKHLINNAPKTIEALKNAGMRDDELLVLPFMLRNQQSLDGGLRCFTNTLKGPAPHFKER